MLVELRRPSRSDARAKSAVPVTRRVGLVSVPFGGVDTPSLAIGLLASALRRDRHHVDVHHFDLDVVSVFGLETYRWVAEDSGWKLLVGEWLGADPSLTPGVADEATFRALLESDATGIWRRRISSTNLRHLRAALDRELARWAALDWSRYDVVGFTVMFQQTNLSLRLARAIKERHPHVRVVLGGINLEQPTGDAVAKHFPFVDAVFTGYADQTFPHYVATLPTGTRVISSNERINLDELPVPTYDEYLEKLAKLGLLDRLKPQIPLETSRGCWWGQKHHCIFCGLNGAQMAFLAKSSSKVVDEIKSLGRYGRKLFIVDNILSNRVYDELLPRMADEGLKLSLRWSASLKANLTRKQLRRLADAGIDIINPGIESLSSDILRLMDKGETSMQNVWLLRACREMSIVPEWHLLHGFPGENPAEYREQAELIARIRHLPAPHASVPVSLVRFSPMHKTPERFGLRDVRPHRAYAHAFGAHPMLDDFAYVFESRFPSDVAPEVYAKPTIDAVRAWQAGDSPLRRPRLEWAFERFVIDTRGRIPKLHRLSADGFKMLARLDAPTLPSALEREWDDPEIALAELRKRGMLLERDGRLMRLVVFPDETNWVRRVVRRVRDTVRRRMA